MRALITGIAGFAGSHLAEYLLAETDWEVWGTIHHTEHNVRHLQDQVKLRYVDLRSPAEVTDLLQEVRPDRIYHLAGQSYVPASWRDPWQTFETNVRSEINLMEAILAVEPSTGAGLRPLPSLSRGLSTGSGDVLSSSKGQGLTPRVLIVASDQEYGAITRDDLPVDEETPLRPASPYAVSKVAQDMLGLQYHLNYGLFVVRVRPFNHIGPRQRSEFVAPAFAQQLAEIEAGLRPPVVRVGNLDARRDFTDVRDMVRAYFLALERGEAGAVYNIGAGRAHSIRELLDILLDLSSAQVAVEQDPARMRPSDVPDVICDATKFCTQTGWAPQVPFHESLRSVLNYWRQRVQARTELSRSEGVTSHA